MVNKAVWFSHTSFTSNSALACGFITIDFFIVSVQPLDEVKVKVEVEVPLLAN